MWQNQCTPEETLDKFGDWLAEKVRISFEPLFVFNVAEQENHFFHYFCCVESEDSGLGERWRFGDSIYGNFFFLCTIP